MQERWTKAPKSKYEKKMFGSKCLAFENVLEWPIQPHKSSTFFKFLTYYNLLELNSDNFF